MTNKSLSNLTTPEQDAVYAALRLLASCLSQRMVNPDDGDIGDILTNSGAHPGLSAEQIQDLCDSLLETT